MINNWGNPIGLAIGFVEIAIYGCLVSVGIMGTCTFDKKLAEFKKQLTEEQKMENDHLTKLNSKVEYWQKGNKIQRNQHKHKSSSG